MILPLAQAKRRALVHVVVILDRSGGSEVRGGFEWDHEHRPLEVGKRYSQENSDGSRTRFVVRSVVRLEDEDLIRVCTVASLA